MAVENSGADRLGTLASLGAPPPARVADGYSQASEAEAWLLAIARQQDRIAFARLFEHYAPRIKSYLCARGSSAPVADELVQDVMLTVWRKAALYDPARGAASTWLFTIARNGFLNHVRRVRPEPEADDPAAVEDTEAPVEEALVALEARRAVVGAVAGLPDEQAAALDGAYFRGRTLRELALEQGVPLGTVKTRVRLGLARLRRLFETSET